MNNEQELKVGQTSRVFEITCGTTFGGEAKGNWTAESEIQNPDSHYFVSYLQVRSTPRLVFYTDGEAKLVGRLTITKLK